MDAAEFERATYRKVTRRLIPFLFTCLTLAYFDRTNIGFAKLQMQQDLAFSDTVYGLGAGMFFIGYFLFEVPSNVLLQRLGARIWIARIMITWGLLASAMMFTNSATTMYVLRFLLGVAEAGFFPAIILYLTFWYTRTHRARMIAAFMTAIALSGVLGGLVSGWIMQVMGGVRGLANWQWLFLLEGLPSVLVGILALAFLDDGPATAKWLTAGEKELLAARLEEEDRLKASEGHDSRTFGDAFRSGKVWLLCAAYFGLVMGNAGLVFWLPQIIKDTLSGVPWKIGVISTIPWGVAAVAMVVNGSHSDRTGERCWHIALPAIIGAAAFTVSALPGIPGLAGIIALTIAASGVLSAVSAFWSLPTGILSGTAAAVGIAWINSVGNLAGYVSPFMIGKVRDATSSMTVALGVLAFSMLIGALLVVHIAKAGRMRTGSVASCVLFPLAMAFLANPAGAQASGGIRGKVADQNGRPVVAAVIDVRPTSRRVTSDEDGKFYLDDLEPGSYALQVRRIGYEPAVVRVDVVKKVVSTTVTLAAVPVLLDSVRIRERATGLRFSGIVVDDAGNPVPEAIVVAEGMDSRIQTDSSGHFRVNDARRGTLIIRARKLGYAPYFGSFRFIGEREDTLRMPRLGNTLPTVEVLERSGFGRDTFVFKDLDARMRWKSTKAGVISREELDQVGHVNLCEALYLTPTGSKIGIHQRPPSAGFQVAQLGCPDLPVCVILDGDRVVWQPLSRYMADRVESVEVFPPNTDISGTVAGRGCGVNRQMAQERVGSPSLQDPNPLAGPFVIWTRQGVPGTPRP